VDKFNKKFPIPFVLATKVVIVVKIQPPGRHFMLKEKNIGGARHQKGKGV